MVDGATLVPREEDVAQGVPATAGRLRSKHTLRRFTLMRQMSKSTSGWTREALHRTECVVR